MQSDGKCPDCVGISPTNPTTKDLTLFLSFLTESDKDWVMGRAILQRLKWA